MIKIHNINIKIINNKNRCPNFNKKKEIMIKIHNIDIKCGIEVNFKVNSLKSSDKP